jgi:hypothetical protein
MATKAKPRPGVTRAKEPSTLSQLTDWVRQGTESFFATQRTLLDLVMRQNAHLIHGVQERLAAARAVPVEAAKEIAGEGTSNFIAAQRVLLNLAQRQNEILLTGLKERAGGLAPLAALTDVFRRGVDTFIDMQLRFLALAAKQTDAWDDDTKTGKRFDASDLTELAREGMENFVRYQKKFLDVIAEETAHATGEHNGKESRKKTDVTELARQAAEAFIDAQKKLLEVATQQADFNLKTARHAVEVLNPLPAFSLADFTRQTVDSLVAAQKALVDVMAIPGRGAGATKTNHADPKTHRAHPKTHRAHPKTHRSPSRTRPEPVLTNR